MDYQIVDEIPTSSWHKTSKHLPLLKDLSSLKTGTKVKLSKNGMGVKSHASWLNGVAKSNGIKNLKFLVRKGEDFCLVT